MMRSCDEKFNTFTFSFDCVRRISVVPILLVTLYFTRSAEKFSFAQRRQKRDISAKQVWKCFIWVTNLKTNHEGLLPNLILLKQTMKFETCLYMTKSLRTKQHETNQKHKKTSYRYRPTGFRQILWFTCVFMFYVKKHSSLCIRLLTIILALIWPLVVVGAM